MKKNHTTFILSMTLLLSAGAMSYAQSSKVKTTTIINGDTTVTEKEFIEKEYADKEKQIRIMINEDEPSKKIVKKIIIDEDKEKSDAMAYAYSIDDGDVQEYIDMSTGENGKTTKIIIRKGEDKKDDFKEEKAIEKKSLKGNNEHKENLNMKISINNTTAKLDIETSSKEPVNVSVLDENGKQVFYDSQKTGGKYSKEIPLGKKGIYFLNIIQNKMSNSEKIIVE